MTVQAIGIKLNSDTGPISARQRASQALGTVSNLSYRPHPAHSYANAVSSEKFLKEAAVHALLFAGWVGRGRDDNPGRTDLLT